MKKTGIFLLTLIVLTDITTRVLFAQAKTPEPTSALRIVIKLANPTPTPKTTQPTSTPAPTNAPTTAPTARVTAVPTAQIIEPTSVPVQSQKMQVFEPTTTPTPLPPTPTPNPKVLGVTKSIQPPSKPLGQIITAPFALVMNSLPQSYYKDQGLAPKTTEVLLAFAFFSLLSGTTLLIWPSLVKTINRMLAPKLRERSAIPYLDLAGKA